MLSRLEKFGELLLPWYDAHARDLPWRASRDPYRVWVSEIMLQQTRVAAVIEHYHEFLRRFPNVGKLAAAREASVLAAWSGLGYYRRARMLHAAAKVIVRERGGKFPVTAEQWRDLPGIGRYTAAAIASIAFGEPVAVVDGNVERVLRRISGRAIAGEDLWHAAEKLLDRERPGDFNQAVMELGATVCTPRAPGCLMCPVVELCATRGEMARAGRLLRQKEREIHYALDFHGDRVFLVQRPHDARLMAGMWELPEIAAGAKAPFPSQVSSIAALKRCATPKQVPPEATPIAGPKRCASPKQVPHPRLARVRNDSGGEGSRILLFTVKHSITVTDYTVRVWSDAVRQGECGRWVRVEKIEKMALTGLARKILKKAGVIGRKTERSII